MARSPLSKLDDYQLVDKSQDIRGWKVQDAAGKVLGRVDEMVVDTDKERVTTLILDNKTEVPVGDIEIGDHVVLLGVTGQPGAAHKAALTGQPGGEVRLQVLEERLRVGKRQVEQGGVRVTTRVEDTKVAAQVQLREEHVNVSRRPVDRPAGQIDLAAMKDRTVDMVETAEVPVVNKQARVVEEVVVSKNVAERSETVRDTVRRTDVEVKEIETAERPGGGRGA